MLHKILLISELGKGYDPGSVTKLQGAYTQDQPVYWHPLTTALLQLLTQPSRFKLTQIESHLL